MEDKTCYCVAGEIAKQICHRGTLFCVLFLSLLKRNEYLRTYYEGWDLGLVTPEDIRRGYCYSEKAGEERALGETHQKILLDFIHSKLPVLNP